MFQTLYIHFFSNTYTKLGIVIPLLEIWGNELWERKYLVVKLAGCSAFPYTIPPPSSVMPKVVPGM